MAGLGQDITVEELQARHIRKLAPFLLGQAVWRTIRHDPLLTWAHLKDVVEHSFGLTKDEMLDAFFAMRPAAGEADGGFILQVDEKRTRLGVTGMQALRYFAPLLSLEGRRSLDQIRDFMATMGGSSVTLTWNHLVERTCHFSTANRLAPDGSRPALLGFGPVQPGPPQPGSVAVSVGGGGGAGGP